jgi:hypothetical protein
MKKPRSLAMIIALLVAAQGVFGFLRAMEWVQIGVDLFGQGLLVMPMIGVLAVARGWIIGLTAALYLLSASGLGLGKAWAWWIALIAGVVNVLLVLSSLSGGESVVRATAWLFVPFILFVYLFSAAGKRLRTGQSAQ